MTCERSAGKPIFCTRAASSGEQLVRPVHAAQGSAHEGTHGALLGHEDVAAVEPDEQRQASAAEGGGEQVGHDPMRLHDVPATLGERAAQGPPGAEKIERRYRRGGAGHALVGLERAAVAEELEALRRVAEGPHLDALFLPGGGETARRAAPASEPSRRPAPGRVPGRE